MSGETMRRERLSKSDVICRFEESRSGRVHAGATLHWSDAARTALRELVETGRVVLVADSYRLPRRRR